RSRVAADVGASAPFAGTLIGNYDEIENPDGTRTLEGLFGGSGNQPIDISGEARVSGEVGTAPTGAFVLGVDLGAMEVSLTGLSADLLGGATPAVGAVVALEWETFRTVNPDSL